MSSRIIITFSLLLGCLYGHGSASASLQEGLVSYFSFDISAQDDFGGTLVLSGEAQPGSNGQQLGTGCCYFNGSNAIEYSPEFLEISNDFTYSMWFKRDSFSNSDNYLLSISHGSTTDYDGLRLDTWSDGRIGYMYGYASSSTHVGWLYKDFEPTLFDDQCQQPDSFGR